MQPPSALPTFRPSNPGLPAPRPAVGLAAAARSRYQNDGNGAMSPGRLLVALYQRLQRDLTVAEQAILDRDIEGAHTNLVHAQEILEGLDLALDRESWSQAEGLSQIYDFVRNELERANVTKNATIVASCRRLIDPLVETWEEALTLSTVQVTPATAEVPAGADVSAATFPAMAGTT